MSLFSESAEQVEEKINPTPEELVRLEEALKNLEEKSKIEEPVVTEETTQYFVDDEEIVVEEPTPEVIVEEDILSNGTNWLKYGLTKKDDKIFKYYFNCYSGLVCDVLFSSVCT